MSDPDAKPAAPGVPSWQRAQPQPSAADQPAPETPTAAPGDATAASTPDDIETARQFLEDEGVRDEPREKKVAFLKAKGFEDADIEKLLNSSDDGTTSSSDAAESNAQTSDSTLSTDQAPSTTSTATTSPPASSVSATTSVTTPTSTTTTSPTTAAASPAPQTNRPPIVTYPEFLAKPQRPPPLVTTNGLFNTLYAFAGLSTILYATSKFVLAPMVAAQTDARHDLHATTSRKLDALVAKLEKSVSEVPAAAKKRPGTTTTGLETDAAEDDDDSEAEDPTEMFHRDMGTQTTFPLGGAPPLSASTTTAPNPPTPSEVAKRQAERVGGLSKSLAGLKDEIRSQSEGMDAIKTLVDEFRDDLDTLTFTADQGPAYDIYGRSRKPDPEDEMRKVRDSIRRVKGVLLSTRNFPASTR